jgi:hypothetical protein
VYKDSVLVDQQQLKQKQEQLTQQQQLKQQHEQSCVNKKVTHVKCQLTCTKGYIIVFD